MKKVVAKSPGKENLKKEHEKAAATIKNFNGRLVNVSKELKTAKANLRKHEVDFTSFEKVRTSLLFLSYKLKNAKLKKRIPCGLCPKS